jgi:hypothetical protein
MGKHIGIGMSGKPLFPGDMYPAENEVSPFNQTVSIVTMTDS